MIRAATHGDIQALVDLGDLMHEESIYAPYDYDKEKVGKLIDALISTRFGIALVAEENGKVVGGFIGSVQQHWFGKDTVATDFALFVAPSHRTGRTGLNLLKRYVAVAKERGAKQIMVANSTGVQPDKVARLFEALGFTKRGYVFEYTND